MPTAITDIPSAPAPLQPPRKRWTREEVATIEKFGFWNNERLELVEGELINKVPKNRPHSLALALLKHWLIQVFGWEFVHQEVPIDVAPQDNPGSEPEPDITVLKRRMQEFQSANPGSADLHLVVEVADTSLTYDLTIKAALYARASIPEYWVLDCNAHRLLVHRNPISGAYSSIVAYNENESIAPLAAPESPFPVAVAFK